MNTFYISPQSTDFALMSPQVSHQDCLQKSPHSTMPGARGALRRRYPWPACESAGLRRGVRAKEILTLLLARQQGSLGLKLLFLLLLLLLLLELIYLTPTKLSNGNLN